MKAVVCQRYGKTEDVVEIVDMPMPETRPNDVLIEVYAASVNPIDFKVQQGALKAITKMNFPYIMGYDVSGVVVEVGENVKDFQVGDAVFSRVDGARFGTFAEFIAVDVSFVAMKPGNVSHSEAASFPLVALTTWQSLFDKANLSAGQKVLIHAGSGGIGTVAIQIAKSIGAFVATTTSSANTDWVKELGADVVIDYKSQQFEKELSDYDVVFETLGGENQDRSFSVLKEGGCLASIVGIPTGAWAKAQGLPFYMPWLFDFLNWKNRRLANKLNVRFESVFMEPNGKDLAEIAALIEAGSLKPILDGVYPMEQAKEALLRSQSGRAKGKIIIEIKAEGTPTST